jgi:hypothetical protein
VVELWRCSRFYFVLVGTNIYPETSYKSREGLQGREIACIDETTDASIYPQRPAEGTEPVPEEEADGEKSMWQHLFPR